MELAMHPQDTIVTDREEGMNNGKVYDWFKHARTLMYTPHPTRPQKFCKRYLYAGKGDDDEMINLPVLSHRVREAEEKKSHWLGAFMYVEDEKYGDLWFSHGMLYLASAAVTEWMYFSSIPLLEGNLEGPEDHQFAYLMRESGIHYRDSNWEGWYKETHTRQLVDAETIVYHNCKTVGLFFRCLTAFDSVDIHHPLLQLENAQTRIHQLGLTTSTSCISKTMTSVRQTLDSRTIPLAELDHLLIQTTLQVCIDYSHVDSREIVDKIVGWMVERVMFDLEKMDNGAVRDPVTVETVEGEWRDQMVEWALEDARAEEGREAEEEVWVVEEEDETREEQREEAEEEHGGEEGVEEGK
ncbi:hypothetical protein HDU98_000062 [Podochytrium sp. JEL0797]|nr:hypothetical protein HDU98_000062 [Podochytrium sp. JEL0797]